MALKNTWSTGEQYAASDQNATATTVNTNELTLASANNAANNLLVDGSYQRDSTWWSAELSAGAVDLSTTQAFSGTQSLKLTGARSHKPNVAAAGKSGSDATYGVISSEGGRLYRLSCRIYRPATNTSSGLIRAQMGLVGAGGTDTTGGFGPTNVVNQTDIPTNQWYLYENTFVVPYSGTNYPYVGVYPLIVTASVNSADVFYVDNVQFEDMTSAPPELVAPLPTGNRTTDTQNLQRISDLAQITRGTLVLRHGVYAADIVTTSTYRQPRIVGQGKVQTMIDGTIKMVGTSGRYSGGWMSGFSLTGSHAGSAAIEFNGACDVHWDELRIEGTYDTGIWFHTTSTTDNFTEMCNGVCSIYSTVTNAVRYTAETGTGASFHGCGLLGGSEIGRSATGAAILIDSTGPGARPYNAPMSAKVFVPDDTTPIIQHNGQANANFHGNLCVEANGTGAGGTGTGMLLAAGNTIYHAGTLTTYLGSGARNMGTFVLVNNFQAVGGLLSADQYVGSIQTGVIPRVAATASASALTPNIDKFDAYHYTALAANLTINAPTGTPGNGQSLRYRFKDNGTSRTLTFDAIFRAIGVTLPISTTPNTTLYIETRYNVGDTKWDVVDVRLEGTVVAALDSNANLTADNFIANKTATATAASTTTLTIADKQVQEFTGSTTQTVALPTTGITAGQTYRVINNSTGNLAVNSSAANFIVTIGPSKIADFTARIDTPTAAADWHWNYISASVSNTVYTTAVHDGNGAITATSFLAPGTSTATAAGTTTLTSSSRQVQAFTGSTTQTVVLPTTSIGFGQQYTIINNSTGAVTVQSSNGNTVATVAANTLQLFVALVSTPTTSAHWRAI